MGDTFFTGMFDGWTDGKGRTLINFSVHCPKSTMFIKSIDASTYVKDATLVCELMEGFIQDIEVHNVVQIITGNTANYVVAGKDAYGEALHFILDSMCYSLY